MFICKEPTAHGPSFFVVDSRETFDAIVEMDANSAISYADGNFGEYKFDVTNKRMTGLTMVDVAAAVDAFGLDEEDEVDDLPERYEDAYSCLMSGRLTDD